MSIFACHIAFEMCEQHLVLINNEDKISEGLTKIEWFIERFFVILFRLEMRRPET